MSKEKQKHTPGPWVQQPSAGKFGESEFVVRHETADGLASHVASMSPMWICDEHGGSVEANARLIAAAPELYSALQLMLEKFQDGVRHGEAGWDAIEAARSAIYKVEAE